MSAPEVGDRVTVTAGQWAGSTGRVTAVLSGTYLWVDVEHAGHVYSRALLADEVEKVPQTRENGPRSDARGEDVGLDVRGATGAHRGVP